MTWRQFTAAAARGGLTPAVEGAILDAQRSTRTIAHLPSARGKSWGLAVSPGRKRQLGLTGAHKAHTMKISRTFPLALIACVAAAATYAKQPPDVVVSDQAFNTAMGTDALHSLARLGANNTASGYEALYSNTTGGNNTASGSQALLQNEDGSQNTAFGAYALEVNTSGNYNTASGAYARTANTSGSLNTASGVYTLQSNTTGNDNTGFGYQALRTYTIGVDNTALGIDTLFSNQDGYFNIAVGSVALANNTSGAQNTGVGYQALAQNTTGNKNIAVGNQAGHTLTTGSNNIEIGNLGLPGDTNTIRIGQKPIQKAVFIAGIYGTAMSGSPVVISSTGQLCVTVSSERFKMAVTAMGSSSAKLKLLRPVTFHLKADPKGALQYGLIAEEVAKVYPDLAIRDESGRIDGVRYDELAPMLLNEVQRQAAQIRDLNQQMAELMALKKELHAALAQLQGKDALVAQR